MKLGAFDDLEAEAAPRQKRLEPLGQGIAGITAVNPDEAQPAESTAELLQHETGSIAILQVGRMDHHGQNQTHRVNQEVALSSHDLLARIVAAHSAVVSHFNALAVEDRSSRGFFFPLLSRTASRS